MKELLIILFQDSFSAIATKNTGSLECNNPFEHAYTITRTLHQDKFLFYDSPVSTYDGWKNKGYKEYLQLGIDEQERILNAFIKGFIKEYDSVVLIKSNYTTLTPDIIKEAFIQLQSNDYVIGPSAEGSFYLLGMKKLDTHLFEVKALETEKRSLCEEMISTLKMQDCTYYILPELEGPKKENVLLSPKTFLKSKANNLQLITQN